MEIQTSDQLQNRPRGAHLGDEPHASPREPVAAKELLTLDFSIEELKSRYDANISGGACGVVVFPTCGACSCAHPGD